MASKKFHFSHKRYKKDRQKKTVHKFITKTDKRDFIQQECTKS